MTFIFDALRGWDRQEIRRSYRKFGLIVVRNVLNAEEVARCRAELDRVFREGYPGARYLPNFAFMETEAFRLSLKPVALKALREALGEPLSLHLEINAQRNAIGIYGLEANSGWHCDGGADLQYTPHDYLLQEDYSFAKVALFLQDFDNGWAGGVRFIPGSHKRFYGGAASRLWHKLLASYPIALKKLGLEWSPFGSLTGPTRAGDLCFFDWRLLHSSALPSAANLDKLGYGKEHDSYWKDIPRESTKYVLYTNAGAGTASAMYLRNSIRRAFYDEPESDPSGRRLDYSLQVPEREPSFTLELALQSTDLPADVQKHLKEQNVRVAEIDPELAAYMKSRLARMLGEKNASSPRP